MKSVIKKVLVLGIICAIMIGAFAGCTGKTANGNSSASGKKLEPVTLKIMLPGDRPKDWDVVKAEAEKRMEKTINVKLDVAFVPWTDIDQKSKVSMTSGEEWDLMWDAPGWPHFEELSLGGYYEPLDTLLKKYGKNITDNRPELMFNANKINGKTYGVPLEIRYTKPWGFYIRKDLREKYGMAPIKTWDDLVKFMYTVKEKDPGIIPFIPHGAELAPFKLAGILNPDMNLNVQYGMVLYTKNNDGKIYNFIDNPEPVVMKQIEQLRKLYLDGIISKDTLQLFNSDFGKGKTAVTMAYDIGVPNAVQASLAKAVPGATSEFFTLFNTKQKLYSTYKSGNFICVPVASKNKERAIEFLNWANEKDNYDLLAYGIKGQDWEEEQDGNYKVLTNSQYPAFAYDWLWNPKLDRISANLSDENSATEKYVRDAKNFKEDKLAGFTFNQTPVKNEMAQYSKINLEIWRPMIEGVLDYNENFSKYKEKAEPLIKKIQQEYQNQVDVFLKAKK